MVLVITQTSLGAQPKATHSSATPSPSPIVQAAVVTITYVSPDHIALIVRSVFPRAKISVDRSANAIIIVATADDIQQIRTLVQALDVQSPTKYQTEAVQLRIADPRAFVKTLHSLFPDARIAAGPNKTVVVAAPPQELAQIKSVIASIDVSIVSPPPTLTRAYGVKIFRTKPQSVANSVSHESREVRAAVSGSTVVLTGPPDDVAK